jgi:phage shock protein PspC (stress-responsive transcriptional regulator)
VSLSEEIGKLGELHQRGVMSDDEFARAKARVIDAGGEHRPNPTVAAVNGLRRSRDNRWLGGVCGGLGQITGFAAWAWRALFALLVLCAGTGVLVYLLLWVLVPEEEPRYPTQAGRTAAG